MKATTPATTKPRTPRLSKTLDDAALVVAAGEAEPVVEPPICPEPDVLPPLGVTLLGAFFAAAANAAIVC